MEDESNIKFYITIILTICGLIGWFIRKQKAQKHIQEMQDFANSHNYVFISKPGADIVNYLAIPGEQGKAKIYNYLEMKEKNWTAMWVQCEREIKSGNELRQLNRRTTTSISSLFIFKFDNIIIPEFEIRDNQGLLDSVTNFFTGKVIKLDQEFSTSYTLKGTFETQIKKFFTPKVKSAFLKMDKNNMASERNLSVKDLGGLLTGYVGNNHGVQFYGKDKKIYIFCGEKGSLAELQNFYKIASNIANAIVQEADSKKKTSSNAIQEEPKDELSSFLANQEAQFSNSKAKAPLSVPGAINRQNITPQLNATNSVSGNQYLPNNQINENFNNNQNDYTSKNRNINQTELNNSYEEQTSNQNTYKEDASENDNNISPTDQLVLLSAMMIIDKDIHKNELKNIVEYGLSLGLEKTKIEQIVYLAKHQPEKLLHLVKTVDLPKNEQVMRMLIRVAFADGKIAKEELELLRFIAKKMNFLENELKVILEEEKNNFRN